MIISHNLSALNTYRQVKTNNNQTQKSLEKLSSGLRINRASDDAAGFAISEKMRGQIRGLGQAARNAQDAISLIQTAEGAASSIHDMLQRGRELSVQASTGTLTNEDRSKIQLEVSQILSQIDETANNTAFNTQKLLNQAGNGQSRFPGISQAALDQLTNKLPGWINDGLVAIHNQLGIAYPSSPVNRPMKIEYYTDSSASTAASMGTSDGGATLTLRVNVAKAFDSSGNLQPEGVLDTLIAHEVVHALQFTEMDFSTDGANTSDELWFIEGLAMTIQGGNLFGVTDHNVNRVSPFDGDYRSAYEAVKVLHELTNGGIAAFIDRLEAGDTLDQAFQNTIQDAAGTELAGATGATDFNSVASFINWFNANTNGDVTSYITSSSDFTQGSGAITTGNVKGSNSNLTLDQTITNGTGTSEITTYFTIDFTNSSSSSTGDLVFQVGANSTQTIELQRQDLTTSALGIEDLSVETDSSASSAISSFESAIEQVSAARSYFGAMQNRLEHTISNLTNAEENLMAAESRIRDLDMAKEMMNFQKNNILSQAAQAMLAQANQQPQGILQLLH